MAKSFGFAHLCEVVSSRSLAFDETDVIPFLRLLYDSADKKAMLRLNISQYNSRFRIPDINYFELGMEYKQGRRKWEGLYGDILRHAPASAWFDFASGFIHAEKQAFQQAINNSLKTVKEFEARREKTTNLSTEELIKAGFIAPGEYRATIESVSFNPDYSQYTVEATYTISPPIVYRTISVYYIDKHKVGNVQYSYVVDFDVKEGDIVFNKTTVGYALVLAVSDAVTTPGKNFGSNIMRVDAWHNKFPGYVMESLKNYRLALSAQIEQAQNDRKTIDKAVDKYQTWPINTNPPKGNMIFRKGKF